MGTFYNVLKTATYSVASGSNAGDFHTASTGSAGYNFTTEGRLIVKILTSLGYKLNIYSAGSQGDSGTLVSAMPLLAFAKIWCDWFANPQYDTRRTIEAIFKRSSPALILDASDVANIFTVIKDVCYAEDYFTSAWDNPVGPNGDNLENNIKILDNTYPPTGSTSIGTNSVQTSPTGTNNTPNIHTEGDTAAVSPISQFMLNALHSVTDFVTRHKMVGSRALDRYMAENGIALESAKLDRSVYLGKARGEFNIADVTQTTPTEGTQDIGLGNYAGKMIGSGNGSFQYTSDEYGYIIVTTYIEPKNMYVDGRPRMLQHLTKLDFFNGDFDNLGVQAIRKDELAANGFQGYSDYYTPSGVFGFTPRYAEYKVGLDNLSGDFLLDSKNASLDGWYLARRFQASAPSTETTFVHNAAFCVADNKDYRYIWQDATNTVDHFFTVFRFNVESYAPMKTMFDMYDYSNEDGKDLTMNINGTQLTD